MRLLRSPSFLPLLWPAVQRCSPKTYTHWLIPEIKCCCSMGWNRQKNWLMINFRLGRVKRSISGALLWRCWSLLWVPVPVCLSMMALVIWSTWLSSKNPMVNYIVLCLALLFEGAAWFFPFKNLAKLKENMVTSTRYRGENIFLCSLYCLNIPPLC